MIAYSFFPSVVSTARFSWPTIQNSCFFSLSKMPWSHGSWSPYSYFIPKGCDLSEFDLKRFRCDPFKSFSHKFNAVAMKSCLFSPTSITKTQFRHIVCIGFNAYVKWWRTSFQAGEWILLRWMEAIKLSFFFVMKQIDFF